MSLVGATDELKIWNFLKGKLGNAYGTAGLMGNLYAESGLKPKNLQNSYESKLGYTDDTYTDAVDGGSYTNFVHDSAGYGLAQWTYWSRKQNLYNYCKTEGTSIGDLEMQLNFLYNELSTSYPTVLATLQSATDVTTASNAVLMNYEKPADMGETVQAKRASYGESYYNKYAGTASNVSTATSSSSTVTLPSTPFTVKVLVDDLNIRSAASMSGTVVGVTGKGTFTITETSGEWGKLKSGQGWIYLGNSEYVTIGSTASSTTTSTATSACPYIVRVTASKLNIRKGPGTNYAIVGTITGNGLYTIVEESNNFGKLKSGAGWICLDYVKKQ